MNGFIERFEKLLQERNEKRADFCRNTEIKESTIRGWTYRNQTPSVETALKIADYFGVSVEWLFKGEGDVLPEEERTLLKNYRNLSSEVKEVLQAVAREFSVTK